MGAQRVQAGVERRVGAAQRVGGERSAEVGGAQQTPCGERPQCEQRGHRLGAVDERQPFLGLEHQRPQPGPPQALLGRQLGAADAHAPAAEKRQRQMGEGREVAARPHRAATGHHRQHVVRQQREQRLERFEPHARVAARQRVGAQQQHAAHRRVGEPLADARRMAQHQPLLQGAQLVERDAHVGEVAETGVDAVYRVAAGGRALDHRARREHAVSSPGGELDANTARGDGGEVFQGQRTSVYGQGAGHDAAVYRRPPGCRSAPSRDSAPTSW